MNPSSKSLLISEFYFLNGCFFRNPSLLFEIVVNYEFKWFISWIALSLRPAVLPLCSLIMPWMRLRPFLYGALDWSVGCLGGKPYERILAPAESLFLKNDFYLVVNTPA